MSILLLCFTWKPHWKILHVENLNYSPLLKVCELAYVALLHWYIILKSYNQTICVVAWQKNLAESTKVLIPKLLLLPIRHVWPIGWPGTGKKIWHLQNALLDESRVLNLKCPTHFAGRGVLEWRVVFPMQGMGSTRKRLPWSKIMSLDLQFKMIWTGSQLMGKEHVYCVESYTISYAMITILRWRTLPA